VTEPTAHTAQRPTGRTLARIGILCALATVLLLLPGSASANVQTYTYKAGPITVGGYAVKQDYLFGVPHPNVTGAITNMEVDVVDADGTPVPIQRLMLHHIVFVNGRARDKTCDSFLQWNSLDTFPAGERFFAAGEERAKMALPPGYGYRMGSNDPWVVLFMFMNHRPTTDSAYIQYKITVDDDLAPAHMTQVKPYWFDVQNCKSDPIFNVPGTHGPGSTFDQYSDFVMPESGRFVAGAGHVHGGARKLTLTEPDCGDRVVAESDPTWGLPDHPFYNVQPVLHEPGPINMTAFQSQQGIPVAAGERLRLNALYDDSLPHVRVMGIFITYFAPDSSVTSRCAAPPGDIASIGTSQPGRAGPIPYRIPLIGLDANGNAINIRKPPGRTVPVPGGTRIKVDDRFFSRRNVRIRRGQKLNYVFEGHELHNVTLANGPRGFGSPNLDQSRVFTQKFGRAGTYRLFCALHPVQMQERVVVKRKRWHRHHR
jgi:hypothetical protein